MDRAADLRKLYDRLWAKLDDADASAAARLGAQIRIIGAELEKLEAPEGEVPLVDQLAAKRAASGARRSSARRRKSG